MISRFDPKGRLIFVEAEVAGPSGTAGATLVLDTGATGTSLNANLLRSIGYDPDSATEFARMTTGTGISKVPRMVVTRLGALGTHAIGLRVLVHTLPAEAAVDGLLGLDFFQGRSLTIDFRTGTINLS